MENKKLFILIISVLIIVGYAVFKLFKNKRIYRNLNYELGKLEDNYIKSDIYKEAIDMYDEYIQNNLCEISSQTFTEEFISSLDIGKENIVKYNKNIKNTGANCILLGVLGTFIGLVFVLFNMKGINTNEIENAISGMYLAFVTSILGIVVSMVINHNLLKKFSTEHITMQIMLKIENLVTKKSTYNKSLSMNNTILEVKKSIEDISESIKAIERFDEITIRLNEFIKSFKENIENLDEVIESSKDFIGECSINLNKLDTQFVSLNENFQNMFSIYRGNQEFNKEMIKNTEHINECVTNNMSGINRNIQLSTNSQQEVNNKLKEVFELMEKSSQSTVETMGEMINMINTICQKESDFDTNINYLNTIFNSYLSEIKEERERISTIMKSYNDLYEKIKKETDIIKKRTDTINENFGEEVEKLLGQFERYIYTTNKIIDNKLDAMNSFLLSEYSRL